jgi:chaperonin GroES
MKLKPLLDKIIIKLKDPEEITTAGIVLANAKNEGIVEAEVVAVGPGAHNDNGKFIVPCVQPGNRILVNSISSEKFPFENEEYLSIVESEVIAILS